MRRSVILALLIASPPGLAACTHEAVDGDMRAEASADGDDRAAADAASEAARDIAAVDQAAADSAKEVSGADTMTSATHELGTNIEDGRTKPQASPRNKSVGEATQY